MPEAFLPVSSADMKERGWDQPDFLFICGDAYVDHPSFGHALLSRLLEREGYRVAMLCQPDWRSTDDFKRLGRPRLGVLISSGVIDSMVNNYTAAKKRRREDVYSPGGKGGRRPDRALIVYANRVREAFGDVPIIIGGLEASLRRFAHYDYWQDAIRSSVLVDSRADILIYGNGEGPLLEIAALLERGVPVKSLKSIKGTAVLLTEEGLPKGLREGLEGGDTEILVLPSREAVIEDKKAYARAFILNYREQNAFSGKILLQADGNRWVVQNRPAPPMTEKALDSVYSLPYVRRWHPMYDSQGGIPALNEVEFSVTSHRGCFGGCSFCAVGYHQGRVIQARSEDSVVDEIKLLSEKPGFKGYIHDIGGPTANFRKPACKKQLKEGACKNRECLFPKPCKNLETSHDAYLSLLKKATGLPGVKKVFVRSGVRFDYALLEPRGKFLETLCKNHISGQLKVAPEHVSGRVLEAMGKPGNEVYTRFVNKYREINRCLGKEQYLVPYFISGHPGSTLDDAILLAQYIKSMGHTPEQVQQFIPTPGTLSTCMYYTGLDPRSMKPLYVPRTEKEQAMQRALLQYNLPENRSLVAEALRLAGRMDLIGYEKDCLIPPDRRANDDKPFQKSPTRRNTSSGRTSQGRKPKKQGNRKSAKNQKSRHFI